MDLVKSLFESSIETLNFFIQPSLHFVNLVNAGSSFLTIFCIGLKMVKNIRESSFLMVFKFISDLAMDFVIRKMISAPRNYWITPSLLSPVLPTYNLTSELLHAMTT